MMTGTSNMRTDFGRRFYGWYYYFRTGLPGVR
jgi:hypothetical protein